jgi:hypothetical protein
MTIAYSGPSASSGHKARHPPHFHGAGTLVPQLIYGEYVHPRRGVGLVASIGGGKAVLPRAVADVVPYTRDLLATVGIQEALDVPADILCRG